MKTTFLILLLCCSWHTKAQNYGYSSVFDYQNQSAADFRQDSVSNQKWKTKQTVKNVSKTIYTDYTYSRSGNRKMKDSAIYHYDPAYRISAIERYTPGKKGQFQRSTNLYERSANNLVLIRHTEPKSKHNLVSTKRYDSQNRLLDETHFNGDSTEILERTILKYDAAGNNTSTYYFKGNKLMYHKEFEYYEDSAKKKTWYYYKNQLYRVYNYECKNYGTAEKPKQKDTTTVCERIEYDSLGRKMRVNEQVWDGKTYRAVNFYDARDHNVEYIYYDDNNKIVYRYVSVYTGDDLVSTSSYKKGGIQIKMMTEYKKINDLSSENYVYKFNKKGRRLIEYHKWESFKGM